MAERVISTADLPLCGYSAYSPNLWLRQDLCLVSTERARAAVAKQLEPPPEEAKEDD